MIFGRWFRRLSHSDKDTVDLNGHGQQDLKRVVRQDRRIQSPNDNVNVGFTVLRVLLTRSQAVTGYEVDHCAR